MARLEMATEAKQDEVRDELALVTAAMGFAPNSLKIMAHRPDIVRGFVALVGSVMGPGAKLAPALRQLIALKTSAAAGCSYCQAHTGHGAENAGVSAEKIEAVWQSDTSPLFSPAERAALALADVAGKVPNQTTQDHFEALKAHFSNEEITEIVAVISAFGFLNRWNDTLATFLEDDPRGFAESHLVKNGWEVGAHG